MSRERQNTLDRSELNVLIIEAHAAQAGLMRRMLTNLGVGVIDVASRGEAALDILNKGKVDLLFCDVDVPGVDGVEFLHHLGDLARAPAVCLLSGNDERIIKAAEAMARMCGLNLLGSLDKPFDSNRLDTIVSAIAGGRSAMTRGLGHDILKPADLDLGLQKGAIELLYQPHINVGDGSLSGVEAFLRWHSEKHGTLGPGYIIPAAERHGFIDDVAREVISQAVDQAAKWKEDGLSVRMAVNISDLNLNVPQFPEFVAATVSRAGIETELFALEIAESALGSTLLGQANVLNRFRRQGLHLTLDDFGGGIDVLDLQQLPFSDFKVDRAFVAGASRDPEKRAAFRNCVQTARELRIPIIAKGVETHEDWMFVIDSGGTAAQGFHIAKPMAPSALRAWASRPNHAPGKSGINLIA